VKRLFVCTLAVLYGLLLPNLAAESPPSVPDPLELGDVNLGYDPEPNGTPPYVYAMLDHAGYSDKIYYRRSPKHSYQVHELLSGEWGAAIYYNGIQDGPKAMWLTDKFVYPNWYTGNDLLVPDNPGVPVGHWQDQNNPTPLYDTGRSVIKNAQVRIQIDYEIADLAQGLANPNAWVGSPMGLGNTEGDRSLFVRSDRYVLLQTYTITNKREPNESGRMENIEFYQMLHSHGADDYGPAVYSAYDHLAHPDPLAGYTAYDPIHATGDFRYDITQWNDPALPQSDPYNTSPHRDWVGFSSTRVPDMLENGYYRGHSYEPLRPGTHWDIEDRNLNGVPGVGPDEVAGALGWTLGALAPNESVSITVAFMFAHGEPLGTPLLLTNQDDVQGCVSPGDYVTYRLDYANPLSDPDDPNYLGPVENAVLVDYLPAGIDLNHVTPSANGVYDRFAGTVTWNLGTLAPGEEGYVTVAVKIGACAEPASQLVNQAKLASPVGWVKAAESTAVCCYGGEVIYVAQTAGGCNTGTS